MILKGAEMSKDKEQNSSATIDTLSEDTAREMARYLTLREIAQLARASQLNKGLFQPILDKAKAAHPLLTCVVQGNPSALATLVKDNPKLLFEKGQVSLNKEYGLALMSQDTRVKPNRLYLKTMRDDGSLQYTVMLTPQEAPITATITPKDLAEIGINTLSNPLSEQDIKTRIKPELASILEITTPRGHTPPELTYYDVSPYQLMTFLCDEDMKESIMQLVMPMTQEMQGIRQAQYAEIDTGGADLVKMDQDPKGIQFKEVTRFITSYTFNNQPTEITFPLLENPDGVIYYKDASTGLEHLFYANQETKTVELIEPITAEHQALDRLYASFREMEPNSARRSSNDERELIANTMHHRLQRKGIQYDQGGTRYCDNRADFNQHFNARRKCIRLYQESKDDEGDNAWCELVGQAERKVMWLLQRICEENRPFFPLLTNFKTSPFLREFNIFNYLTGGLEPVFSGGHLVVDFGSSFGIYKGRSPCGAPLRGCWPSGGRDLLAVSRLVESAKANVVELTPQANLQRENTDASYHRGPG